MFDTWFLRHRNRYSVVLHAAGIPLTILGIPVAIAAGLGWSRWWYAAAGALVVVGYALQFIGHAIEGNDAGEVILVKKMFGRPYKAVADGVAKETRNE